LAHAQAPSLFDWEDVNIRADFYERALVERDFTEELCKSQLVEQRKVEDKFAEFWKGLRLKLNPYLGTDTSTRPKNYAQAAQIARQGLVLTGLGGPLYRGGSGSTLNDSEMKVFMEKCPPFRSVCYGLVGGWFDISLAPQVYKRLPGRNDLMMSIYLPYCRRFVTADWRQEQRLREVAIEAKIECDVQSFGAFCRSFDVLARQFGVGVRNGAAAKRKEPD
jgi:hypothetical protein